MSLIRVSVALALALLVSACLPVSTKAPLGTTAGIKPDSALIGLWRGQNSDNEEAGYIGFIKNDDDTMTAVLVDPGKSGNSGEWETFSLKVTTLGGKHYMTARETFVKDKAVAENATDGLGNIILLYRIEGKTLKLFFADEKRTAALIKMGKLHGTVSDDTSSPDITLTSDSAELDKFFASPAAESLFVKPALTLTKLP